MSTSNDTPDRGRRDVAARPVVNLDELDEFHEMRHGERFEARLALISRHLGAQRLAYNLTVIAPGKRAFPFHNHHVLEEMFLILEGEGTLRFGDEEHAVRAGDVIACPPGGPEVAHQLVNTGEGELRVLAVSTEPDTDVMQYPDSGKLGVVAGRPPGAPPMQSRLAGFYDESGRLDYWEGE